MRPSPPMTSSRSSSSFHLPSVFQFGFSGLGALMLWGIAFAMAVAGLLDLVSGTPLRRIDPSGFLMAAGFGIIGWLLIPSAWFAFVRLTGRAAPALPWATWKNAGFVIWLLPPVLLAGYGIALTPTIAWLLLPIFNVLALGIPVVWYLSLGGRGLQSHSPQSAWGVFAAGLVLGPGFILFIELVGALAVIVVLVVFMSGDAGFLLEVQRLGRMVQSSNVDPNQFIPFFEKYLLRPPVILGGLSYIAIFVPLLEELFKPIGLLFLNRHTLTPARGFLAGMLSGAAFGLFENLLQAATGADWILLALGRFGTSLIHIFNSGLVGWGLALALQKRSPRPFFSRYLLAVLIHGLWNGTTVMVGLASYPGQVLIPMTAWQIGGTSVLFALGVACFFALIAINRRLQYEEQVVGLTSEETSAKEIERSLEPAPPLNPDEMADGIENLTEAEPDDRVSPPDEQAFLL